MNPPDVVSVYTHVVSMVSVAACGLPSETGPCRNFTVKWYFDPVVGSCTRFWYGGCDGNNNRFDTREECQASCVQPEGIGEKISGVSWQCGVHVYVEKFVSWYQQCFVTKLKVVEN